MTPVKMRTDDALLRIVMGKTDFDVVYVLQVPVKFALRQSLALAHASVHGDAPHTHEDEHGDSVICDLGGLIAEDVILVMPLAFTPIIAQSVNNASSRTYILTFWPPERGPPPRGPPLFDI